MIAIHLIMGSSNTNLISKIETKTPVSTMMITSWSFIMGCMQWGTILSLLFIKGGIEIVKCLTMWMYQSNEKYKLNDTNINMMMIPHIYTDITGTQINIDIVATIAGPNIRIWATRRSPEPQLDALWRWPNSYWLGFSGRGVGVDHVLLLPCWMKTDHYLKQDFWTWFPHIG